MVISIIVAIGIVIGVFDLLRGNKWGLGAKMTQGFTLLGPMMMCMAGVMALAPAFAKLISPVIVPLFKSVGIDPGVIGFIMGSDMGGYQLAMSLAENEKIGFMAGGVTAGMFGGTMFFSIPLGFSVVAENMKKCYSQGLLIGICTIPIGSILCGLVLGLPIGVVLLNDIPIIILSGLVSIGFALIRNKMIAFMGVLGKIIDAIGLIGIAIGCVVYLLGIDGIPGMLPILESMDIVCGVTITMLGMFPLVELFNRVFKKGLIRIGEKAGLDAMSVTGIICTPASASPVFEMLKDMSPRGAVINSAWIVCDAALIGSQLGLVMSVKPQYVMAYLAGKLGAGIAALVLAFLLTRDMAGKTLEELEAEQ